MEREFDRGLAPVERPRVADFVRYLATHGDMVPWMSKAEVRRLTELVGTQWSAERMRPDGRVIEVRSNPVPGGGVVLIYSDITERKRAEAEIHAARDTAEKALQELQTAQASLLHAQKMAALGQLTAGIAHEIKNPLNFVNNFAELSGELLLELKETTAPAVAALGEDERAAVDEVLEMRAGAAGDDPGANRLSYSRLSRRRPSAAEEIHPRGSSSRGQPFPIS